jgi:hypothetical protein
MKWLIEKCRNDERLAKYVMYSGIGLMIVIALL